VTQLIEAVQAGDVAAVRRLLTTGARLDERDGDDWCALDWAAGRGDVAVVQALLDHGADPLATGKEERTPYQIALAAGQVAAVRVLAEAEDRVDPDAAGQRFWRPYCKAYLRSELARFPGFPAEEPAPESAEPAEGEESDDGVVFIHDDYTVTKAIWRGEDVVFDAVTDEWRRFCTEELGFAVPTDLDLVPGPGSAS